MPRIIGWASLVAFIAVVWLANWSITKWGLVSVGFGLMAPAGVYFAGAAFTLRDLVHQSLGRSWVLAGIVAGAGLSAGLADAERIALASGIAFGVSELFDLAIYEPLRKKGFARAVLASNAVGLVIDSVLFLSIAFGSLAFLKGQIVGKAWVTIGTVALIVVAREVWKKTRPPSPPPKVSGTSRGS
jgi:hypothetical protein